MQDELGMARAGDLSGLVATAADATYWVDAVNGSDSDSGLTLATAFKTIMRAVNLVPQQVLHKVEIKVKAGTYAETLIITQTTGPVTANCYLKITGQDWTVVTPTTGAANGTFTSTATNVLTLAAAGWTVNDLQGRFLHVTSGAKSGSYIPICSNTATGIETPYYAASGIGNASFEIVTPAAVITKTVGQTRGAFIGGGSYTASSATYGLVFANLHFNPGGATDRTFVASGPFGMAFTSCQFTTQYVLQFSNNTSPAAALVLTNCYSACGTYTTCGVSHITATGCYFKNSGISTNSIDNLANVLIDGGGSGTNGITLNYCTQAPYIGSLVIRGCDRGIQVGGSAGYMNQFQYVNISACAVGIEFYCGNYDLACAGSVLTRDCSITACTSDAIRIEAPHIVVHLGANTDISGNTGFGVNLAATTSCLYNALRVGAAATMGTNTAGDMTLDGTNPITLPNLKLDADKIMVDALRFNRVAAD